jgi:ABC-2 type transport system ATP-binding protein
MAAAPASIEMRHVTRRFGSVTALSDVSWTIAAGETVVLLGANGAGKTTAISLMVGLRGPTSGEVRAFGLPPNDLAVRRRRGVMLQDCEPIDHVTVLEAIDLFRSFYPTPLDRDAILRRADLSELARRRADALSHGQRQRLFFGQAIAGDPTLLFLDEPTAGMDVESRRALQSYVRDLAGAGRTIVLSTHDMSEAAALASRILVLRSGRVVFDGTPDNLLRAVGGSSVVRFAAPVGDAPLAGLPAERVDVSGGMVSIRTQDPAAVVAELARRGVRLDQLAITGPSIEDAYVALTERST